MPSDPREKEWDLYANGTRGSMAQDGFAAGYQAGKASVTVNADLLSTLERVHSWMVLNGRTGSVIFPDVVKAIASAKKLTTPER